ncbi:MAG TPA: YajQ family cyclic di-GMP-binding protein [Chloroflexota bacterium]|nr:YajQ family cyclic di-GMP-binding protein [Chloroflexota bacterium]
MAGESSFDVVSEFDRQELVNAIDQAEREMRTRYDLKDTKSEIKLEKDNIVIRAPAEITLNSVRDLLQSKMIRRNLSLKILKLGEVEQAAGGTVRQVATLQQGISQDLARDIVKLIRDTHPKAKAQVQGDAVRVTSKGKDELQGIIATLKAKDYPVPLQFTNYR